MNRRHIEGPAALKTRKSADGTPAIRLSSLLSMFLAAALLPAIGQAAGYTFTSFQYPGATNTYFTGIDDTGRIVGYANIGASSQAIFLTAAGSLATVNVPGFDYALPASINRLGGIVGQAFQGSSYSMFQDNVNGFGPLAGNLINQTVSGINSSFNTVGNYTTGSQQNGVYVLLGGTYYTVLPAQICSYTHDPAINDLNVVVGSCVTHNNKNIGFTWTRGVVAFFQPPAGVPYMQPTSINNSGVIAGWYTDVNGFNHGFVLKGGTFTTVDHPAAGAYNTQILGINNAGKLVGSYYGPAPTAWSATPQ